MTASWPPSFEAFEAFATLATFSNGREPRHREFLAGVHVGVLEFELSGAGACRSPVWCRYGDGGVVICLPVTEPRDERMTELARATLEISDDGPPFERLVLEGPVRVERLEHCVVASLQPETWRRA